MTTAIQWTDETWNPSTGCTKISPGCANCYIERTPPFRMEGRKFVKGHIPLRLHADRLDKPLKWRKPRRVFVNSLSDLFHEDVPFEFIRRVWRVMVQAKNHTFQILTKRPERMAHYLEHESEVPAMTGLKYGDGWLPRNIWLGTSVEDQKRADERIPHLLRCPAAVRFLSCEPLLGPVDLFDVDGAIAQTMAALNPRETLYPADGIGWVIVGGESGPRSRPCNLDWIRGIVDQCKAAEVACFVKQLGAVPFMPHPGIEWTEFNSVYDDVLELKDKKGGDWDEWDEDLRVREFPSPAV